MSENTFVQYLDQFNVLSPNHAKIYDEYTHDQESEHTYSFSIRTKIEEFLIKTFNENPQSIILTGNAGDGKTRLCRLVYDHFSNETLKQWPNSGIVDISFPNGTLRIVKDLSELKEEVIFEELLKLRSIFNQVTIKRFTT